MTTDLSPIPYTRRVWYLAYASFPATGNRIGDLAFATDRMVFYRWSGADWQPVTIHSSSGAAADIPTAADLPNGSLYFETDTGELKQVQSGAWAAITAKLIGTMCVLWMGLLANIPAGWVLCDGGSSTYDMRERYPVGAPAATEGGSAVGANSKTTDGHAHTNPAVDSDGGHAHTVDSHGHTIGHSKEPMLSTGPDVDQADDATGNASPGTDSQGNHQHTQGNTGSQTDTISDIRPSSRELQFIMKT